MAFKVPPPPVSSDIKSPEWRDWFYKVAAGLSAYSSATDNIVAELAVPYNPPVFLAEGGDSGDGDSVVIPGPIGNVGPAGPQGPAGPAIFLEAEPGEEGMMGPPGPSSSGGTSSPTFWFLPFAAAHG